MANDDAGDHSFVEFIDDYFVECEDHLAVARRSLLALERSVEEPQLDRPVLDELFRSFHSIKGLSAMVGIRPAERLAHEMESYLGALREGSARLTAEGIDALIGGVKALEQVIVSRRQQTPAPDVSREIAPFAALSAGASGGRPHPQATTAPAVGAAASLTSEHQSRLAAAAQTGAQVWRFTFAPSSGLAGRGVNVNTVRQRLQAIGELIHAAPIVQPGGQIAFAFIVVSLAEESTFQSWRGDGIDYQPFPGAAPAEAVDPRPSEAEQDKPSDLPPSGNSGRSPLAPSNLVRVDLSRLDDLMRMVGELVINRARLDEVVKRLAGVTPTEDWRALQESNQALERLLRDLREGVMRVRMVPVREIFARMQFVVRDLAREHGRPAKLELSGEETEIDKFVVDRMMDPLLHLVRNAVSHALESPEERDAGGKPRQGTIALRASTTGETITIEVEDDGRGIDAHAVFARGRAAGLIPPDAAVDPAALLDLICAPGFSTRDQADRASGRGVGMAVVRTVVEDLGGLLTLETHVGRGTRFTIQLPLTLAIADALIVSVGGQRYAVPQVAVREVIQVESANVTALENNELVPYRGGVLPLMRLRKFFHAGATANHALHVLVTGEGLAAVGLGTDRVLGLQEIVVRPLTDPLVQSPGIAGATELGDGHVVLILDTTALGRVARRQSRRGQVLLPRFGPASTALLDHLN